MTKITLLIKSVTTEWVAEHFRGLHILNSFAELIAQFSSFASHLCYAVRTFISRQHLVLQNHFQINSFCICAIIMRSSQVLCDCIMDRKMYSQNWDGLFPSAVRQRPAHHFCGRKLAAFLGSSSLVSAKDQHYIRNDSKFFKR